ncbi:hypothetical protein [Aquisphaera insulae]|uniref:hypothetical protein n=1 Tax=Aquisphaera insulae TaxID=2712864 RepID=UPI0013ECC8B8|nr:hypothetical protein [Aquisphaera insulae]
MAEPPPRSEHELEIAAADWLLGDGRGAGSGSPLIADGDSAEFKLVDIPPGSEPEAEPDAPPPAPKTHVQAGDVRIERTKRAKIAEPARPARVEQVWSRGAEWGPSLVILAVWAAIVLALVYLAMSAGFLWPALGLLVLGGLAGVVLCYPIFITLERPVRITPEQAARDYFNALSHRLPHYRRMWLLLSEDARNSSRWSSFGEFVRYWNERRRELSDGKAGILAPLVFHVAEFRADDKSAGKTEIEARFKVRVQAPGPGGFKSLGLIPLKRGFVRGPDKMWYLNDGCLESSHRDLESDDPD